MSRIKKLSIVFLVLLAMPVEKSSLAETGSCDISVFSKNGQSIRIHVKPNGNLLAKIPLSQQGAIFHATKHVEGWLYYDTLEVLKDGEHAPLPENGWIRASDVSVNLNMSEVSPTLLKPYPVPLKKEATTKSQTVHSYFQERVAVDVLECCEKWVKVRVKNLEGKGDIHTGWLGERDYCGNPVTNCP